MTIDLSPVRDILQADGGDIELVSMDGPTANLRLIIEGAECAECVLPRPLLEDVASKLLGTPVRIDDPRESEGVARIGDQAHSPSASRGRERQ